MLSLSLSVLETLRRVVVEPKGETTELLLCKNDSFSVQTSRFGNFEIVERSDTVTSDSFFFPPKVSNSDLMQYEKYGSNCKDVKM